MELAWWPSTGASRMESGAGADWNESWLPSLVDKKARSSFAIPRSSREEQLSWLKGVLGCC